MGFRKKNVATGDNTVIGSGTIVNGNITSAAALIRIDGEVNGDIDAKGDMVIGNKGVVNGNLVAANLNIGGRVTGNATVAGKVEIESSGSIYGDLQATLLAMDEKAIINGKVTMINEAVNATDATEIKEESGAKAEATAKEAKESDTPEEPKAEDVSEK